MWFVYIIEIWTNYVGIIIYTRNFFVSWTFRILFDLNFYWQLLQKSMYILAILYQLTYGSNKPDVTYWAECVDTSSETKVTQHCCRTRDLQSSVFCSVLYTFGSFFFFSRWTEHRRLKLQKHNFVLVLQNWKLQKIGRN